MRLLVCDDDESVRRFAQALFSAEGWDVRTVSSGEACLSAMEAFEAPDVLVVDHVLPGLSGIETLRRARAAGYDRPAVLFSAYLDDALSAQAEELHAVAVSKADILELVGIVSGALTAR